MRRRMSLLDGPQSSPMSPVAGMLNGPSVLFRKRPTPTFAKICIRRQFHRLFAAFCAAGPPPGGGGGGGGPPAMIITIGPALRIAGPDGATLKLMLAPTFRLF